MPYAIKGVVECKFGEPASAIFQCLPGNEEDPFQVTLQRISLVAPRNQVEKEQVVTVPYFRITGYLDTQQSISGSYVQAMVGMNVFGNNLPIKLKLGFTP